MVGWRLGRKATELLEKGYPLQPRVKGLFVATMGPPRREVPPGLLVLGAGRLSDQCLLSPDGRPVTGSRNKMI